MVWQSVDQSWDGPSDGTMVIASSSSDKNICRNTNQSILIKVGEGLYFLDNKDLSKEKKETKKHPITYSEMKKRKVKNILIAPKYPQLICDLATINLDSYNFLTLYLKNDRCLIRSEIFRIDK